MSLSFILDFLTLSICPKVSIKLVALQSQLLMLTNISWAHAVFPFECSAKMREVIKSPLQRNLRYSVLKTIWAG
jgi:hypothetical protein